MEIIEQHQTIFLIMAFGFGLYMTWGIGANDVANAMGTSVGSGALTVKQAIIVAAIMEFAGAYLAGGGVASTISKGIIDGTAFEPVPELLVMGMLSALLAAGIWLMVATMRGWPVSTTHTIIGAVVGVGVAAIGMDAVHWDKMGEIVASWFVSPVLGGFFALLLTLSIRKLILNTDDPISQARKWGPFYAFLVGWLVSLVTITKGLKHIKIHLTDVEGQILALVIGVALAIIAKLMMNRIKTDERADKDFHYASVEKLFIPLMVFTGAAMAFAHGSNDVANGIGPMAAVIQLIETKAVSAKSAVTPFMLFIGGVGIVIGLATYGYKVMATIGNKITELTPTRGYCATIAASFVVVLASGLGLPVSTTHIAVGAVMGVGLARGIGALDLRVIGGIILSWFITVPVGAILAAIIFYVMRAVFS
ncbi:MAG: Low-affinity inorganic phosphate transporter 1 [Candidatus Accumulibacter regalis]|jgi:PiT family inorganic phosphate transporter|uniref:Phosphate transporter n=1 Tax=Accumulibacter regalis TaxID=522306 RepID=A0A011QN09_ACCRE|nr:MULTISPECIES: inorganic phosphate transporter [unclassified Candidatus Accumulibacter]EXI90707.1 MAG: Low-affinity inorganic phosphate transporter 1 [Candidatus Accumulibacter regalis]MBL8366817.1 inorganic phosphate transporter [Accumulibacter sp.]MBN8514499.1 inorganic phosphate transporter [Accumulibacter sp.]HRE69120.1 inorganic phosphate transporter [Accumulibacter sp.]HRE84987.1 inorganic phosphate transporter [Accumulibacter sp.]